MQRNIMQINIVRPNTMQRSKTFAAISVLAAASICSTLAQNRPPITGQWTIGDVSGIVGLTQGTLNQGRVQFEIRRTSPTSNMSNSGTIALSELRGLTSAQLRSAGSVVRFEIVRDAGTLQCEGFIKNGGGGGSFVFAPNPNFPNEIRALGYGDLNDEQIFSMAVHDVSAAYVRELAALGVRPDSSSQLITMRIHNVAPEYIKEFQSLGYSSLTPEKLVTMRIHRVTANFARELREMGYNSVSTEQMVTMRIHGASTDFIKEIAALGYNHPGIDQLVTMRIHGITPEFIRKTRARGLGNLPIEQLVSLKIHGVVE
jgi:hypothetical protein